MVSGLITRIRSLFFGSTLYLILLLSVEDIAVPQWYRSSDTCRRIEVFANALIQPQRLAVSTQTRHRNYNRQQQLKQFDQHSIRKADTIQLFAAVPYFVTEVGKDRKEAKGNNSQAYIIEPISKKPIAGDKIYNTIANLCIDVFFKVSDTKNAISIRFDGA